MPASDILDNLETAIVVVDGSLAVADLNTAAENLLGVSRTRAIGRPLLPYLDDDRTLEQVMTNSLATGQTYGHELILSPNAVHAARRIVDCRVTSIAPRGGEPWLLVEMTDVTRRMRISRENALIIQHGAGRQMVRQLAHEIKNPLGGLRGAAQLLARQLDSDELREYTDVIISEADRLVTLVDTLLGPGGPPNKREANIHELIEYVIRLSEAEAGSALEFVRDYDPGLPTLALDRDQIVQALLNLVKNARDALDNSGRIVIRTRATTNFTIGDKRHATVATIEVEDDGPGIAAELQDSVFYPLVTSRSDGTGLGLPVAQDLLSRHGGLIEFDSRPGRTVFYVHLPLGGTEPGRG